MQYLKVQSWQQWQMQNVKLHCVKLQINPIQHGRHTCLNSNRSLHETSYFLLNMSYDLTLTNPQI